MAISFAIISFSIAKMLLKTSRLLESTGESVSKMETRVDQMIGELEETLYVANRTIDDMDTKLEAVSSAFYVVRDISDTSANLTDGLSAVTRDFEGDKAKPGTNPFVRVIQFSELAFEMVKSWKQGTKATRTIQ